MICMQLEDRRGEYFDSFSTANFERYLIGHWTLNFMNMHRGRMLKTQRHIERICMLRRCRAVFLLLTVVVNDHL